ncbi:MAG: IS110 family transposase [Acidobacteria bacterium]|nr:MAG: IS110 family transposase [Acidobacteriota bacterium]
MAVSAKELVVAVEGERRVHCFANTAAGHKALLRALTRKGRRVRVVLEATGLYGLDLALALSAQEGIAVMVANPRAVRHFAQAMMQRSKNDRLDAGVLREFAARMPFQPWARPGENTLALWAIARRLEVLVKQRTAEKNRQHAARISQAVPLVVRREIARSLRELENGILRLRREARRCIAADARLQRQWELLCSITGVAEVSAVTILAELAMLPEDRDVRQWVAFAGLDPREYSSGTSVRKQTRISKVGNRHLRHALYMPALVACRYEPHVRDFYQRLLKRGKKKRQALLAVARKLLHAIYGMFRTLQPFDGTRLFAFMPAKTA